MIKNLKITLTSILSIIIIVALFIFFGLAFGAILLIFFATRMYSKFMKKKDKPNASARTDEPNKKTDIIDVEEDDYKVD